MSQGTNALFVSIIGIDTGKNTLRLVGIDHQGATVFSTRLANVPRCWVNFIVLELWLMSVYYPQSDRAGHLPMRSKCAQ
jgi:hypothetical protein